METLMTSHERALKSSADRRALDFGILSGLPSEEDQVIQPRQGYVRRAAETQDPDPKTPLAAGTPRKRRRDSTKPSTLLKWLNHPDNAKIYLCSC